MMEDFSIIGKPLPKIDAYEIVTGEAKYIDDLKRPRMLHGKILRSRFPHAKILNINTSKAEKLPGVKAVITAEDTPKLRYGIPQIYDEIRDEPVLADDRVRFYGDRVAAVAAVDLDTAEEALDLIEIDYEVLPAVFDPEEAMKPGAPQIHDFAKYNIAVHKKVYAGDVEKGFAESDVILEGRYSTQGQEHSPLEPHGAIAEVDTSGNINVWTTTQTTFTIRRDLVKVLDLPLRKINVHKAKVGGAFGGKNECTVEPHALLLSMKTGRPVKITYTREEEFIASTIRHPMVIYSKIGAKKNGTVMAKQAKLILNNGAYTNHGIAVAYYMGTIFASLYRVEHVKYDGYVVYTNCTYGGAFRGYGNPQITFAIEAEMDKLAEKLGMDPMEFRLMNAPERGDITASGLHLRSCGLRDCIVRTAMNVGWAEKWGGWPG